METIALRFMTEGIENECAERPDEMTRMEAEAGSDVHQFEDSQAEVIAIGISYLSEA